MIVLSTLLWLVAADPFADIKRYDRDAWSQTVTVCDELAAHGNDPEAVASGVSQAAMDIDAAIAACTEAVAADRGNPRLNYQLARAYGYAGRHAEGEPYRDTALRAGYPQSLFVVGYIRVMDWDGRGKDACYGGELIRRSAEAGRFAGLVGFPHYALLGEFDGCDAWPRVDREEMLGFLDTAASEAGDYYQRILVQQLADRVRAMGPK